jgi:hypothetical protein
MTKGSTHTRTPSGPAFTGTYLHIYYIFNINMYTILYAIHPLSEPHLSDICACSGRVVRDAETGEVVIGRQYQDHNPRPGPVYAGGGYTGAEAVIYIYIGKHRYIMQLKDL